MIPRMKKGMAKSKRQAHPEEDRGDSKKRNSRMNRYIPFDIITQILPYLPCKSIVRFKAACKQWNSFIQRDQFINDHICRIMRYPSHFLVWDRSVKTLLLYQIGKEERCTRIDTKFVLEEYEDMLPSSYGLVCFHNPSKRSLAVCNPTTRCMVKLPDYPEPYDPFGIVDRLNHEPCIELFCHNRSGFGFDPKSRKYKVIQLVRDSRSYGISGCWVLNVSQAESYWRMIDDAIVDCAIKIFDFPICVDGVLYWEDFLYDPGEFIKILAFDLNREVLKMISSPAKWSDQTFRFCLQHLVELQGNLCYVEMTCEACDASWQMNIWMLSYSNDRANWDLRYKLELGSWFHFGKPFTNPYPLYMNHERIILKEHGQLYSYDTNTKSLKICKGFVGSLSKWLFENAAIVHSEIVVLLD